MKTKIRKDAVPNGFAESVRIDCLQGCGELTAGQAPGLVGVAVVAGAAETVEDAQGEKVEGGPLRP